ncbi:hypothetical protein V1478_017655 [Vespula squamosa]|uniref:Secreted protein n=1 Tax=Vespula squamosa TaxID=30214 RepID=A0ABD1ZZ05_VESSQ
MRINKNNIVLLTEVSSRGDCCMWRLLLLLLLLKHQSNGVIVTPREIRSQTHMQRNRIFGNRLAHSLTIATSQTSITS